MGMETGTGTRGEDLLPQGRGEGGGNLCIYLRAFQAFGEERQRKVPAMRLPRGRRFDQKPLELIEYLKDKVEGRPDAGQGVINDGIDVYGFCPEQLLGDSIRDDDGRSFFFAPIKHRRGNDRDRSTPNGRWDSRKKKTPIHNRDGSLAGYMQYFHYHYGKKKPETTEWRMKEYVLKDDPSKMALCVIYRTKCKDRIQGNELRMEPLKHQEAIDSESEDARLHYLSNDSSSWGKATEDECRQYLKSIAEKTGESYDKKFFMARKLDTAGAPKFSQPEGRVGPSEGGGFFSSKEEEGFLSAPAANAGSLSGGEGHTGFNRVTRDMDLNELMPTIDPHWCSI